MTTIRIDSSKVNDMVRDTLHSFHDTSAHPAEVVLALAECIGRVIAVLPSSDITKRELADLAIKHMATSIEAVEKSIIVRVQ